MFTVQEAATNGFLRDIWNSIQGTNSVLGTALHAFLQREMKQPSRGEQRARNSTACILAKREWSSNQGANRVAGKLNGFLQRDETAPKAQIQFLFQKKVNTVKYNLFFVQGSFQRPEDKKDLKGK